MQEHLFFSERLSIVLAHIVGSLAVLGSVAGLVDDVCALAFSVEENVQRVVELDSRVLGGLNSALDGHVVVAEVGVSTDAVGSVASNMVANSVG